MFFIRGEVKPASEVFKQIGIEPYVPKAKEGLSLINGTQVMTVIGAISLKKLSTVLMLVF